MNTLREYYAGLTNEATLALLQLLLPMAWIRHIAKKDGEYEPISQTLAKSGITILVSENTHTLRIDGYPIAEIINEGFLQILDHTAIQPTRNRIKATMIHLAEQSTINNTIDGI